MKKTIFNFLIMTVLIVTFAPASYAGVQQDAVRRLIEPTLDYDNVSGFCEGMAAVQKNLKVGFIDPTGKVIVPLEYDHVFDFHAGLAIVQKTS